MAVSAQGRWWGSSSLCVNSVKQTMATCNDDTLSLRFREGSYWWPWPPDSIPAPFGATSSEQAALCSVSQLFTSLCCPLPIEELNLELTAGTVRLSPKGLRITCVDYFLLFWVLLPPFHNSLLKAEKGGGREDMLRWVDKEANMLRKKQDRLLANAGSVQCKA